MKIVLSTVVAIVALVTGGLCRLARADGNVGWLDVTSEPSAEIFIDDVDRKLATPQTHMPLPAGHHKLKLVAASGGQSKIGFSVAAGKTTRLTMQPR